MTKRKNSPELDREAIYRTKEILCDFSEMVKRKILLEKDAEEKAHLEHVYEMIPTAQFIIGMALGAQSKIKKGVING